MWRACAVERRAVVLEGVVANEERFRFELGTSTTNVRPQDLVKRNASNGLNQRVGGIAAKII
jgi:hypothetical protein